MANGMYFMQVLFNYDVRYIDLSAFTETGNMYLYLNMLTNCMNVFGFKVLLHTLRHNNIKCNSCLSYYLVYLIM